MSPVAISGLALPSGRISTTPETATQNSARRRCAWASTSGARNTTCATPEESRRSMKMTPPWSRRRATQPANVTCWPASPARSEPAAWLRSTNTSPLSRLEAPGFESSDQSRGGSFSAIATNIALVGPGAVGTTVAALLYKAGHPVLVCGRTPRDSIELRPDGEDPIVLPGPVHTDPREGSGPVDLIVLAVKATQNVDPAGWRA